MGAKLAMLKKIYLGNIIKSTRRVKNDAFGENYIYIYIYGYLCEQARKALFGMCMYKKTRCIKSSYILLDVSFI